MKLLKCKMDAEYVKEAIYITPMITYSNEINSGKNLWIGWLKWLFCINF